MKLFLYQEQKDGNTWKLNAKAIDVELTTNEISEIENIIAKYPNTGDRYGQ